MLIVPRQSVPIPGAEIPISLRGLSPADIGALMREDETGIVADAYLSLQTASTPDAVKALAMRALAEAPKVVAKGIARAADEPDSWQTVQRLPFPVQMRALSAIAELTFTSDEAPGELLAVVATLAEQRRARLNTSARGSRA